MDTLEELKKIALTFKIDPLHTIGHAARVTTIIKVLTSINASYRKFLEIEFHKNENFHRAYIKNNTTLNTLLTELDLLAVDLQFSSCQIAVAPNVTNIETLFKDEVTEWKKESFNDYKEIIEGDFENSGYISKIKERYTNRERSYIYKSIFNTIGNNKEYKLHLLDTNSKKIKKTLYKPNNSLLSFYLPKKEKEQNIPTEKLVHAYVKVKDNGKEIKFNKKNIKEVFFLEELEYATYPFTPSEITLEDKPRKPSISLFVP